MSWPKASRNASFWPRTLAWGFLFYSPFGLFTGARFSWQLLAWNHDYLACVMGPGMIGALCGFVMLIRCLFRPSKNLPFLLLLLGLDCTILFSPFYDDLASKSFADFIKPEAQYVQRHCEPLNFHQDGKIFQFGLCNLKITKDGVLDFDFVYDSSGDTKNYSKLSADEQKIFVDTIRRYVNDDPASGFEYADFTAQAFYPNFYYIFFDEAETEGFTARYGRPPQNPKNQYSPLF